MESLTITYINSKTYTNLTSKSALFYNKVNNTETDELSLYSCVLQQLNIFDTNTRINILNPINNLYKYHINESIDGKPIYDAYIQSMNTYINALKSKYPDGLFEFTVEIKDSNLIV